MPLAPPPPPLRLSSRPLLVAAVAFALGVVGADAAPGIGAEAFLLAVAVLAVGAGGYAVAARRRMVTLHALAIATVAVGGVAGLGASRLAAFRAPERDGLGAAAEAASEEADAVRGNETDAAAPVTVWGRVASVPVASEYSVRFVADVDSAQRGAVAGAVSGRVQVGLEIPQADARSGRPTAARVYPALRLGDRVRLTGRLAAPPARRNPADMDYGAFLRGQGIASTLRVEAESDVVFLAPAGGALDRLAFGVQRHVRRAVARHVPGAEAQAVVLALLVADWSHIEDSTVDAFRDTGLLHLLSVSGLHLVFVGLALYALLGPVLSRLRLPRRRVEWIRTGVTLVVMFVYVVAAGSSAPVVRAFVMAAVLVVGRASERRVDTLNGLGLAALGLLFWRPTALFEAGFQLSFGAVAALVACAPVVTAWLPEAWTRAAIRRSVTNSLVASVVATLGTAPILLAWFGKLPLSGILLNLPAIPLTSAALGGGLGASVCAGWWPAGADLFGAFASVCVRALLVVSRFGAETMGGLTVERFVTSPFVLAALAAFVLVVAFWPRPVARRRLALAAVGLLAVGTWTSVASGDARPVLDAVFLDVGQGDATLLRLPGGHAVLIDAGDRTDRGDEGLRTVVPHLARYGVRHLDALVLTHPHADHVGGAVAVLEAISVGRLVHNGQADDSAMWRQTLHTADSLGVATQAVVAGDTLGLDPAVRIRVLGPSRELAAAGEANEASVILLVEYGTTRWLLAGDAETAAEADVVARYAHLLRADVVKVGHHGSRTSSTLPFVAAASGVRPGASLVSARASGTAPDFAVVSVGRRNRHGLPDEEPVMRWLVAGADVLQTADQGAVWLQSDGETVRRVDWRGQGL